MKALRDSWKDSAEGIIIINLWCLHGNNPKNNFENIIVILIPLHVTNLIFLFNQLRSYELIPWNTNSHLKKCFKNYFQLFNWLFPCHVTYRIGTDVSKLLQIVRSIFRLC